ncbi:TonB-dependent siderophore receptor [Paraflavitalea pollutisoli]|uniref:TonB-dependent siderophore receptor n=1 Tax=Paraflavitalea pollutisoli TaxID=3034143 RepID=UPI0023EB0004|nr:TonB-dependent siderophore receptor [Paraflavitalea sp. H1-2-19X]
MKLYCTLLGACLAMAGTAQQKLDNKDSVRTLKAVVVSSTKLPSNTSSLTRTNTPLRDIPQQVQVIDRSVLNDQQLLQLNDAFRFAAGITATDFYGGFSSRGYTTGIGSITTNGIKGSPYPEGQLPLLGNIESVEVLHGPTAIMNGPGAMGGNVNMVTKQPKKFTTLNGSISAGSFDLYRAQADITGSLNKKKNLYFLAGAGYQNGGSFTQAFDRRSLQLYGALKWEIGTRTTWQVNANYVNDDASNNYQPRVPIYNSRSKDSIFLVPYDFNPGTDSRYKGNNLQLQSIIEHSFSDRWKLSLLTAYNEARAQRAQYFAAGFVRATDNTVMRSYSWQNIYSPQTTVNGYLTGQLRNGKLQHQFITGADAALSVNNYPRGILQYAATRIPVFTPVKDEPYDTTGMARYTDSKWEKFNYNVIGLYIQDQVTLLANLKFLAGLRYNNYFRRYKAVDHDDNIMYDEKPERTENFSPRLGLVYQPTKTISVYLDYNEGFEPHYGNFSENGGPFDPLTSRQYEIGAKGEFFQGQFQPFMSIYQSTRKNVLQSAPRDGFPQWQEAIGAVRSRGVEMGARGVLFNSLLLIVNYNYNKTKTTESKNPADIGQLFANNPQNSANGWARYTLTKGTLKGLFLGGGFQYVDSRYFSAKKPATVYVLEMPAYTTIDALIGYRYKQYSLQVNGNNLADKRYALSGVSNSYTPGMPRNWLVTLSYALK